MNAHTVKSTGARFCSSSSTSSSVSESLPPESADGDAIAVANHLESRDRFADLAQKCFFEVQKIIRAPSGGYPCPRYISQPNPKMAATNQAKQYAA